jgi:hypothetical protein
MHRSCLTVWEAVRFSVVPLADKVGRWIPVQREPVAQAARRVVTVQAVAVAAEEEVTRAAGPVLVANCPRVSSATAAEAAAAPRTTAIRRWPSVEQVVEEGEEAAEAAVVLAHQGASTQQEEPLVLVAAAAPGTWW